MRGNDCIHVYQGRRTGIPYRTLYSKNIANLFMAGRCDSATHIALGGTRVMRPMCATGQAVGTAAAIATAHRASPRGVYERYITDLQQALLRDGCYLPGVKNADPADLARRPRSPRRASSRGPSPPAPPTAGTAWSARPATHGPPTPTLRARSGSPSSSKAPAAIAEVHVTAEDECPDFRVEAKRGRPMADGRQVGGQSRPADRAAIQAGHDRLGADRRRRRRTADRAVRGANLSNRTNSPTQPICCPPARAARGDGFFASAAMHLSHAPGQHLTWCAVFKHWRTERKRCNGLACRRPAEPGRFLRFFE